MDFPAGWLKKQIQFAKNAITEWSTTKQEVMLRPDLDPDDSGIVEFPPTRPVKVTDEELEEFHSRGKEIWRSVAEASRRVTCVAPATVTDRELKDTYEQLYNELMQKYQALQEENESLRMCMLGAAYRSYSAGG